MIKNILIIVGLFALLMVAFFFTQRTLTGNALFGGSKPAKAVIGKHTFNLTAARTQKEQEIGLSNKKSLAKNSGMVFPYAKKTTPTFWMKDMKFPIDILFISDDKIVTLYQNVKPPIPGQTLQLYSPSEPIDSVIEINAGLSKEYGIKKGDTVTLTL